MNLARTALALAVLSPLLAGAAERTIDVPADRHWVSTGLEVGAGDSIEVRARGRIDWGRGECGPDGSEGGSIFRPLNDQPSGALLGRIGDVVFFLGREGEVEAPASGELELGVNDDKVSDNSGAFEVRVWTGRGGRRGGASGFGSGSGGEEAWRSESTRGRPDRRRERERDLDEDRDREWFWWRGKVDGTDQLVLRGRELTVKHLDKLPIQKQDHEFTAPLPEREVRLHLEVLEGRGKVSLVQKPARWNDHTAVILIDDSDHGGADTYEVELSWERPRHGEGPDFDGVFRWRGRVDIGCDVHISGETSSVKDRGGRGTEERFSTFTAALPRREVPLSLQKIRGRGKVKLVETPSAENGWTAVVRIEDDKGGADLYEFELGWRR